MRTLESLCMMACVLIPLCTSQLSIPRREVGFVYKSGKPCAYVKLHAYLDLSCPDSQAAYSTLTAVADSYDPQDLQLRVHLFSLPYHRNSHALAKAAHVLAGFKSPKNSTVHDWIKAVFINLSEFVPSTTVGQDDYEVLNTISSLAQKVSGISPEAFSQKIADPNIDSAARLGWKYGCTRGVYGTPMFTVNDVFVNAEATWTVQQWKNLINPLLTKSKHT